MENAGKLYLCATPIGNPGDITLRVLKMLEEVDSIVVEDTRHNIRPLNHFKIKTPMANYHELNKIEKARYLMEQMRQGVSIMLATDTGTPGISDPREELVWQCYEAGIEVAFLPRPAACVTALTPSELSTRRFCFRAFLPADKKDRQRILEELKRETRIIIAYEVSHKLVRTLGGLLETPRNRNITICRELTRKYKEAYRAMFKNALKLYKMQEPKGECVIVIERKRIADIRDEQVKSWEKAPVEEHMAIRKGQGIEQEGAIRLVARDRGISKRDVYQYLMNRKGN